MAHAYEGGGEIGFSWTPNDPLLGNPANPPPLAWDWQWGMHMLKLPQAWDYVKGGSYIGMMEGSGIQVGHEDLIANFRSHFSRYVNPPGSADVDELVVKPAGGHGHGTHVAGIMAASANNALGVTGACPQCSLMVGAFTTSTLWLDEAIVWLVESGATALNYSGFVGDFNDLDCPEANDDDETAHCTALQLMEDHDVAMAASSGNDHEERWDNNYKDRPYINFPARDPRVIAVAAVDSSGNRPSFSQMSPEQGVAAPGVDILSTFYTNKTWNGNAPWNCGDSFSADPGYGPCTGTSMSAPHVTALLGLGRSANPLLDKAEIKSALIQTSSNWPEHDDEIGYGIPDASALVRKILGKSNRVQLRNRLTPLFALYSGTGANQAGDHFHTIVPQMGTVAVKGTLQPRPTGTFLKYTSDTTAPGVPQYGIFPDTAQHSSLPTQTNADVYVATTDYNPLNAAQPLLPIHRLSRNIGNNSDHVYTTSWPEALAYMGQGYKHDGTEGHAFNKQYAQPAGSVRLIRRWNQALDDHAIFPEEKLTLMEGLDYTAAQEHVAGGSFLGYAYPNQDTDDDDLVDGFEKFIGTDPNAANSDCDLEPDGQEFPLAGIQRSDPKSRPTLALYNHYVRETEQEYACASLSAGPSYRVEPSGNLSLSAGEVVELKPGFSVAKGGVLSAKIKTQGVIVQ